MITPTRQQDARAEALALHFDSVGVTMRPDGNAELTLVIEGAPLGPTINYGSPRVTRTALIEPDGAFVGGFRL